MTPLERAVEIAGGQTALAHAIGKKQAHIWYWMNGKSAKVPAELVLKIEEVTGVSRHDLRPDVFGAAEAAE